MFSGRNYVIPKDIENIYGDVCAHRVIPARIKGKVPDDSGVRDILESICGGVTAPTL